MISNGDSPELRGKVFSYFEVLVLGAGMIALPVRLQKWRAVCVRVGQRDREGVKQLDPGQIHVKSFALQ